MKRELLDKWVAALRSGKYKQGRHMLRKGDSFCCLGVLCEVMEIPRHRLGYELEGNYYAGSLLPIESDPNSGTSLEEITGLDAGFAADKISYHLMRLNDGGASFNEIADEIEKIWN